MFLPEDPQQIADSSFKKFVGLLMKLLKHITFTHDCLGHITLLFTGQTTKAYFKFQKFPGIEYHVTEMS